MKRREFIKKAALGGAALVTVPTIINCGGGGGSGSGGGGGSEDRPGGVFWYDLKPDSCGGSFVTDARGFHRRLYGDKGHFHAFQTDDWARKDGRVKSKNTVTRRGCKGFPGWSAACLDDYGYFGEEQLKVAAQELLNEFIADGWGYENIIWWPEGKKGNCGPGCEFGEIMSATIIRVPKAYLLPVYTHSHVHIDGSCGSYSINPGYWQEIFGDRAFVHVFSKDGGKTWKVKVDVRAGHNYYEAIWCDNNGGAWFKDPGVAWDAFWAAGFAHNGIICLPDCNKGKFRERGGALVTHIPAGFLR